MLLKARLVNASSAKGGFTRQKIMQLHASYYQKLSPEEKQRYEAQALTARAEGRAKLSDAIAQEEHLLDRASSSIDPASGSKPSMSTAACTLEDRDLRQLQAMVSAGLVNKASAKSLRKQTMSCPQPMSASDFVALQERTVVTVGGHQEVCRLARRVAVRRDYLKDSVIAKLVQDDWSWFRFVNATLQPTRVTLQPLQELDWSGPAHLEPTFGEWRKRQRDDYLWAFSYEMGDYSTEDIFADDSALFFALGRTDYRAPNVVASNDELLVLEDFLASIDVPVTTKTTTGSSATSSGHPAKKRQAPPEAWMASLMQVGSGGAAGSGTAPAPQHHSGCPKAPGVAEAEELVGGDGGREDDDELADMSGWQDLEAARVEFASVREEVDELFRIDLEGGQWSLSRSGREIYGCRCHVRKNTAFFTFCQTFKLAVSASFSQSVYGEEGSVDLAMLWRLRLHHLWQAHAEDASSILAGSDTLERVPMPTRGRLDAMKGRSAQRRDAILSLRVRQRASVFFSGPYFVQPPLPQCHHVPWFSPVRFQAGQLGVGFKTVLFVSPPKDPQTVSAICVIRFRSLDPKATSSGVLLHFVNVYWVSTTSCFSTSLNQLSETRRGTCSSGADASQRPSGSREFMSSRLSCLPANRALAKSSLYKIFLHLDGDFWGGMFSCVVIIGT